jgi:hypothetical protein
MDPISDEQLVKLLPALVEAARADPDTASRFVPPRTGVLEETASRHHQFVFGRRGVGKSTLLRKIESLDSGGHGDVIFVDIETLRGRPYPDVLIELLIALLSSVQSRLKDKAGFVDLNRSRRKARKQLNRLVKTLRRLLNEPQTAERVIRELRSSSHSIGAGAGAEGRIKQIFRFRGHADADRSSSHAESREARVEESKMDGLLAAAVLIREALSNAQDHHDDNTMLVVLDDFYHVPYDDQPDVLAYLHQIVKNLGIYLKVCGVRHRINPFIEDDPPRGLQIGHDAAVVSLDITLARLTAAQSFLENVLIGILAPLEIDLDVLVSEGGRQRLVLGSGGVDVNEAAADLTAQKQDDLAIDVGEDADRLRARLTDIVKFCLDVNKTNVFLVEGPTLQEEQWGSDIQALADLRLVHAIGNLSVQTGTYRGRRFVGFTLDLSNYTGTRSERIEQIEFWTPGGKQATRRARLIYAPGAADRPPARDEEDPSDEALEGTWGEQTNIFDVIQDSEGQAETDDRTAGTPDAGRAGQAPPNS